MKWFLIGIMCLVLPGCTAGCQNEMKKFQGSVFGLRKKITVFGADGKEIKSWETTSQFDDQGGTVTFLNDRGKQVIVSGTFVIEEL